LSFRVNMLLRRAVRLKRSVTGNDRIVPGPAMISYLTTRC